MKRFFDVCNYIIEGYSEFVDQIQLYIPISRLAINIIFWCIIGYILIFVAIIPLHRALQKKKLSIEQILIKQIDEMIYLLAKAQHDKNINLKSLGGSPNIALMKQIFTKGDFDYVKSYFFILDNIHKVESLLGEKIIPIEKEGDLIRTEKKYRIVKIFETCFRRIITIPTLGVYLLFS